MYVCMYLKKRKFRLLVEKRHLRSASAEGCYLNGVSGVESCSVITGKKRVDNDAFKELEGTYHFSRPLSTDAQILRLFYFILFFRKLPAKAARVP